MSDIFDLMKQNREDELEKLLNENPDSLKSKNGDSLNPLEYAVRFNHINFVKLIISYMENHIDIN